MSLIIPGGHLPESQAKYFFRQVRYGKEKIIRKSLADPRSDHMGDSICFSASWDGTHRTNNIQCIPNDTCSIGSRNGIDLPKKKTDV